MSLYKEEEKPLFELVQKYTTYRHDCEVWHKLAKRFPTKIKELAKPEWKKYLPRAEQLKAEEDKAMKQKQMKGTHNARN